jgi:hypothetical protein
LGGLVVGLGRSDRFAERLLGWLSPGQC